MDLLGTALKGAAKVASTVGKTAVGTAKLGKNIVTSNTVKNTVKKIGKTADSLFISKNVRESKIGTALHGVADKVDDFVSIASRNKDTKTAIGETIRTHAKTHVSNANITHGAAEVWANRGKAALKYASMGLKESNDSLLGVKVNALGGAVLTAGAVALGTRNAAKEYNKQMQGQQSQGTVSSAPRMPSYANNGGATGDLVFALNKNRRG